MASNKVLARGKVLALLLADMESPAEAGGRGRCRQLQAVLKPELGGSLPPGQHWNWKRIQKGEKEAFLILIVVGIAG